MQTWDGFVAWVNYFKITNLPQVEKGPQRIRAMLKFPPHKRAIIEYLNKRATIEDNENEK